MPKGIKNINANQKLSARLKNILNPATPVAASSAAASSFPSAAAVVAASAGDVSATTPTNLKSDKNEKSTAINSSAAVVASAVPQAPAGLRCDARAHPRRDRWRRARERQQRRAGGASWSSFGRR